MHNWLPAALVIFASVLGIGLTLITLPGTWVMFAVAAAVALWRPEAMPWWVVWTSLGIAVVAEVVEFGAAALGAAKHKATRAGAFGALAGSLLGAIIGSPFLFPIGTIAGGIAGAGLGAAIAERGLAKRSWTDSAKVGGGAAVGRLLATVLKTALAAIMGVLLCVAALTHLNV